MVNPNEHTHAYDAAQGVANPFSVLGLPERFDLNPDVIESSWMRAAAKAHPDRKSRADASDGEGGGGDSGGMVGGLRTIAAVNAAQAMLADPARRAEVLLVLKGGASREQDNTLPEGFLMEIFEIRQDMEEAIASGDEPRIASFEAWAQQERTRFIERVSAQFAALHHPAARDQLDEIRKTLNAWRYIERMIEQTRD